MTTPKRITLLLALTFLTPNLHADENHIDIKFSPKGVVAPGGLIPANTKYDTPDAQQDFPVMALAADGSPLIAHLEYDGSLDSLHLTRLNNGQLEYIDALGRPGIIHQPGLATDGAGTTWCVWSELSGDRWNLQARAIQDNLPIGPVINLTQSAASDVFLDFKADRHGRVWVTWQAFDGAHAEIFAKHYDPKIKKWSKDFRITNNPAGDWEPRLAFGAKDEALIVFDSYRDANYNVFLARVSPQGQSEISTLVATPNYEARPEADTSPDGKTLYVAYEHGIKRWGKDLGVEWRKIGGGLHYNRRVKFISLDLNSGDIKNIADITPLIPQTLAVPGSVGSSAIDVPEITVDAAGRPWLFYRYCIQGKNEFWQIAATRYNPKNNTWTKAQTLANSTNCQDRRIATAVLPTGELLAAWPSDSRKSKQNLNSAIYLASIAPSAAAKSQGPLPFVHNIPAKAEPIIVNNTPERHRSEHDTWNFNGKSYTLYFGDVHRHTDFSSCRTTDDGCITEHYRYALDASGLDYLGTSDHTEVGKVQSPYEWWQTQKFADIFQNPGFFVGIYAYEREQKWPYGHRNILFTKRGGPLVYIQRKNYLASKWATPLGPERGLLKGQIPPDQLWEILKATNMRVISIEHTAAGGMGTDWSVYDSIDNDIENVVEIYQGSRESYEAVNGPQPGVTNSKVTDFGTKAAGAYQNALGLGHKLGVYASSDHRSTNISFGGVYVENNDFTRDGIFNALNAKRTVAATDKIFLQFSCNGAMMGDAVTTSANPKLTFKIQGTAPIEKVTIIRNERDYKTFTPNTKDFETTFTDANPVDGDNRYYIRVIQSDGNMAWASPVWVNFKPSLSEE